MITSSINGRLRFKACWLKNLTSLAQMEHQLSDEDTVTHITANSKTGSLLVCYDHKLISRQVLEETVIKVALKVNPVAKVFSTAPEQTEQQSKKKEEKPLISTNQFIKFGMLGSIIPSMVWAGLGSKKLHIVSGGGFLFFMALHIISYRERLLK